MVMTSLTPWLDWAISKIGVTEVPGAGNNPEIVKWGQDAGIDWYRRDSDAWCAVFVNAALVHAGYPSTKSALARSFVNDRYGSELRWPVRGAILSQPRGSNPLYGHVSIAESDLGGGRWQVVNGNVGDTTKRSVLDAKTILPHGIRWPPGAPMTPEARAALVGPVVDAFDDGDTAPAGPRMILKKGDIGADVEEAQAALDALGYMSNNPEVATFGLETEEAVRAFQKANGLEVDGKIGPHTRSAMEVAVAARAKATKAKEVAEKAAETGTTEGAAMGAGGIAGAGAIIVTVRDALSLNDGTLIGLAVAIAALGLVGYFVYRRIVARGTRKGMEVAGE